MTGNDRTGQNRTRNDKKSQKGYISPIFGEAPTEAMYMKNCLVADVVHVCNFQGSRFYRGFEFSIFLLIFEWALQQCSASALSVMRR